MAECKTAGIRVKYDDNDNARPGWKFAEYEMKGVPLRLAIGNRDIENKTVEIARRDTKEKMSVPLEGLSQRLQSLLEEVQTSLYNKALSFRDANITAVDSWDQFVDLLDSKAGFLSAHWDGTVETEEAIKEKTKATIRCIPLDNPQEAGVCVFSGKPSTQRVLFARAY